MIGFSYQTPHAVGVTGANALGCTRSDQNPQAPAPLHSVHLRPCLATIDFYSCSADPESKLHYLVLFYESGTLFYCKELLSAAIPKAEGYRARPEALRDGKALADPAESGMQSRVQSNK
jgi:hypothetical protein